MADTTILQSFVVMQERKLQAKVEAIARGGQMAVNHQVGGTESLEEASGSDSYESVYALKIIPRHGRQVGPLRYEMIPR